MTEQRGDSVIEALRSRLGSRYPGDMEQGRAEIVRVLRDELQLGADEAEALVRRMIDDGRLRYVTATERDPLIDPATLDGDPTGRAEYTGEGDPYQRPGDTVVAPLLGGVQDTAGAPRVVAAPAVSSSTTTPPPVFVGDVAASGAELDAGNGPGYWEIGGGATGVVPSGSRKGQVEPRGT